MDSDEEQQRRAQAEKKKMASKSHLCTGSQIDMYT